MTLPSAPVESQAAFPDPIPGILQFGSLNLLAGASGVGKTCLLSWLLTRLRDGLDIFGRQVNVPSSLGMVCADRGIATARYWLQKADYRDLPLYSLADDPTFSVSRLRSKTLLMTILNECLDRLNLSPGGLAIVDPMALFMGGNLGDYMSCAVACLEIRRICTKRQITLIGTAHAAKQKADKKERYQRLQDRILGSAAQLGYGDTQLYLAAPEETGETHYTFLWHPHTAPAETFKLGRDATGMFVPWEHSVQAAAENDVWAQIPVDGSVISLSLLETLCAPLSRATLFRRLQDLQTQGMVVKPEPGKYARADGYTPAKVM